MDVSSLVPVDRLTLEEPSKDDDTKQIYHVLDIVELSTSLKEATISLHAL